MGATFSSLLALAGVVYAVGDAMVVNESTEPLYLWSVGDTTGEQVTVQPGAVPSVRYPRTY